MSSYTIIEVPFHLGLQEVAVGKGPGRLLEAGADRALAANGSAPQVQHVRKRDDTAEGLDAVVDVNRQVRYAVRDAVEEGVTPVVLAGNCNACLGVLAGLDRARLGIVWLDAHGDFHTPETSRTGFLDGMSLSIAAGHCLEDLALRIGLSDSVPDDSIVLLGVRDLEAGERERLAASGVTVRRDDRLDDVQDVLAALAARVDAVYLHLDLDVLDASESPGVNFRGPGGLGIGVAEELLAAIRAALPVAALAVTNYNPDLDQDDRTRNAAVRLLAAFSNGEARR